MRRAGGLSDLLLTVFVPLCIWGLISTLVLHLIEIRSVFIEGGAWRLRQATIAFALGIVLIQRLGRMQGETVARNYAVLLGFAITAFAAHHAYTHPIPVHWSLVFLVNEALFLTLWWAGHKITAACSVDSEDRVQAAAESGILRRRWTETLFGGKSPDELIAEEKKEKEKLWEQRLPTSHPGVVILYFSLVALPLFGLGVYLFPRESLSRLLLGVYLFVYLWCALALLFLSTLGQLRAYFERRGDALPDPLAMTWLSLGFALVTTMLLLAYFLPQPPSVSGLYVRERVTAAYRGFESSRGMKDSVGRTARRSEREDAPGGGAVSREDEGRPVGVEAADRELEKRYEPIDKLDDPYLSETFRNSGFEPERRNLTRLKAQVNEGMQKFFDGLMRVLLILGAVAALVVLYALVYSFWRGVSEGVGGLQALRRKKPRRKRKHPKGEPLPAARFGKFSDPFLGSYSERDGDRLVRYLWDALTAFCADYGTPCPPDRTPLEFVDGRPAALEGFEDRARRLAELINFSEYSGQSIPEERLPELQEFWRDLKRHADLSRKAA